MRCSLLGMKLINKDNKSYTVLHVAKEFRQGEGVGMEVFQFFMNGTVTGVTVGSEVVLIGEPDYKGKFKVVDVQPC